VQLKTGNPDPLSLTRLARCCLFHPGTRPERQNRLRQHGTFSVFFTNIWLGEPNVREKGMVSSALPEANRAVRPGEHLPGDRPCNGSHLPELRSYEPGRVFRPAAGETAFHRIKRLA
jgi:hypothetical protein